MQSSLPRPPFVRVLRTALQVLVAIAAVLPAALAVLGELGLTIDSGPELVAAAGASVTVATAVVAAVERSGRAPVLRTIAQVLVAVGAVVPAVAAGLAQAGVSLDQTRVAAIVAAATVAVSALHNALEHRGVLAEWNPQPPERTQLVSTDNTIRDIDGPQPMAISVGSGMRGGIDTLAAGEDLDAIEPGDVFPTMRALGGIRTARAPRQRITADVAAVLATARSQAGVSENPPFSNITPYSKWYGLIGPWCAMWVSWVFTHAGYPLPPIRTAKGFAYCPDVVNWARRNGCWHGPAVRPQPGWLVLFDFPGDGVNRPSHVGIVEKVMPDGRISTWEGNTSSGGGRDGGSVVNHVRSVAGGIIGFVQVDHLPGLIDRPLRPASWRSMRPGDTDARVAARGGFDRQVTEVQLILTRLARSWTAPDLIPGPVDGDFGPRTAAAVTAFKDRIRRLQREHGHVPWPNSDPLVGPRTIAMLRWWNR